MESLAKSPQFLAEGRNDRHINDVGLGRSAVSGYVSAEMVDIPERVITTEDMERVRRTLYADLVVTDLYEHGDITGSSNTMGTLLQRIDMDYAQKGRKIKIEDAVHVLSDSGLIRTRKMIMKRSDDDREYEVFAPLRKPGNFIILNRDNYSIYESWKSEDES